MFLCTNGTKRSTLLQFVDVVRCRTRRCRLCPGCRERRNLGDLRYAPHGAAHRGRLVRHGNLEKRTDATGLQELIYEGELRALISRGQELGFLSVDEVGEAFDTLNLDASAQAELYQHLDELGVDILDVIEARVRAAEIEEAERNRRHHPAVEQTTDALQLFLKDIGRVPLLTAAQEVSLAKRIELGDPEIGRAHV